MPKALSLPKDARWTFSCNPAANFVGCRAFSRSEMPRLSLRLQNRFGCFPARFRAEETEGLERVRSFPLFFPERLTHTKRRIPREQVP